MHGVRGKAAVCAACTFWIVVEGAVISTGVRVRVPEGGGAAAERRELQLLSRHSLLNLSSQSLHQPAHRFTQTTNDTEMITQDALVEQG